MADDKFLTIGNLKNVIWPKFTAYVKRRPMAGVTNGFSSSSVYLDYDFNVLPETYQLFKSGAAERCIGVNVNRRIENTNYSITPTGVSASIRYAEGDEYSHVPLSPVVGSNNMSNISILQDDLEGILAWFKEMRDEEPSRNVFPTQIEVSFEDPTYPVLQQTVYIPFIYVGADADLSNYYNKQEIDGKLADITVGDGGIPFAMTDTETSDENTYYVTVDAFDEVTDFPSLVGKEFYFIPNIDSNDNGTNVQIGINELGTKVVYRQATGGVLRELTGLEGSSFFKEGNTYLIRVQNNADSEPVLVAPDFTVPHASDILNEDAEKALDLLSNMGVTTPTQANTLATRAQNGASAMTVLQSMGANNVQQGVEWAEFKNRLDDFDPNDYATKSITDDLDSRVAELEETPTGMTDTQKLEKAIGLVAYFQSAVIVAGNNIDISFSQSNINVENNALLTNRLSSASYTIIGEEGNVASGTLTGGATKTLPGSVIENLEAGQWYMLYVTFVYTPSDSSSNIQKVFTYPIFPPIAE